MFKLTREVPVSKCHTISLQNGTIFLAIIPPPADLTPDVEHLALSDSHP